MTDRAVRVRFAPSPTGFLHVGGARTALFNYLFARRHGGTFILRIEDTDQTRYQPAALKDFMDSLRWLGMQWDEGPEVDGPFGPYFQSQRTALYQEYAQKLVEADQAYYCYCSSERLDALRQAQIAHKDGIAGYDRHCRNLSATQRAEYEGAGIQPVIRLKAPLEGQTVVHDLIHGDIVYDNTSLDDLVLLKSDGFPTYHLANIIDDHFMQISHVLRADEWLPSTPKHVLLYQAFGWEPPIFAHLPLILDPSGQGKLSKRRKRVGDQEQLVMVYEFIQAGYLPEAMFNFLTLVGWSVDDKTQLMTRQTAIENFDLDRVNKAPAAFSYDKLDWMNGMYIRELPADVLAERVTPFLAAGLGLAEGDLRDRPELLKLIPLIRERMKRLTDAPELVRFLFEDTQNYEPALLVPKKLNAGEALAALRSARQVLAEAEPFEPLALEASMRAAAEALGQKIGAFLGVLRVAITGKEISLPLFESMEILGREKTLVRVGAGLAKLETL